MVGAGTVLSAGTLVCRTVNCHPMVSYKLSDAVYVKDHVCKGEVRWGEGKISWVLRRDAEEKNSKTALQTSFFRNLDSSVKCKHVIIR